MRRWRITAQVPPQLPGVTGPTLKDILQREAERPMRAEAPQRELRHDSLFGDSHQQKGLAWQL